MKKTFNLALSGESRARSIAALSKFITIFLAVSASTWLFQDAFDYGKMNDILRTVLCLPLNLAMVVAPVAFLVLIVQVLIFFIYDRLIEKSTARFPVVWALICLAAAVGFCVLFVAVIDTLDFYAAKIPWGDGTNPNHLYK